MKVFLQTRFPNDILDVIRLYFPNEEFESCAEREDCDLFFNTVRLSDAEMYTCRKRKKSVTKRLEYNPSWTDLEWKRHAKRCSKLCAYECLKVSTGIDMPWGALTGIRPVKLARELGLRGEDVKKVLTEDLFVSKDKTALTLRTLENQRDVMNKDDNSVGFFVNIPFCTSRCAYCSFFTGDIKT